MNNPIHGLQVRRHLPLFFHVITHISIYLVLTYEEQQIDYADGAEAVP